MREDFANTLIDQFNQIKSNQMRIKLTNKFMYDNHNNSDGNDDFE